MYAVNKNASRFGKAFFNSIINDGVAPHLPSSGHFEARNLRHVLACCNRMANGEHAEFLLPSCRECV